MINLNNIWDDKKLADCIKNMKTIADSLYANNAHSAYEKSRADAIRYGIGFVEYSMRSHQQSVKRVADAAIEAAFREYGRYVQAGEGAHNAVKIACETYHRIMDGEALER